MDPVGTSCFSLHVAENAKAILEERKQDEKFNEMIVSCGSLSKYDERTFKTLLPQILAAIISGLFHVSVGISLAFSAILIPSLNQNATEGTDGEISATKTECSWIASVLVVVTPLGALSAGVIMDNIGRLNLLKISAIPTVIGWVLIATAQNVTMIIIGRLLVGFGCAWGTGPAIVYITEIARADMRGSLISLTPTYASLGMVICFLKGWFLHWRTVAWLANGYVIISVVLIFIIPESPVWLVSKGKIEQAAHSLRWINKYQPQPHNRFESYADLQLHNLQREHEAKLEEQLRRGYSGISGKAREFMRPTGYKPIIILCGLFLMQQFSGIYITLFYSVTFFKEVGSTMNPFLASTLISIVRMLMSFINTYMLRTFRRRPLVIISGIGMAICMTFSGMYTLWIQQGTSDQTWVPVLFILLYVVTSMIGLLPIPWTMTAELFPQEIRGMAHSIAFSIANLIMFAAIQSYWTLDSIFSGVAGMQWFFAVVSVIASLYTFVFLPETHGKKLSEITEYFNHNTIFLGKSKETRKITQKKTPNRVPKKDIIKSSNNQSEKLMDTFT